MAKYKLLRHGVLDTEEGRSIPEEPENRHWQEYQEWLVEGNIPDPEDPPPGLTVEEELQLTQRDILPLLDIMLDKMLENGIITRQDLPTDLAAVYDTRKNLRGQ